MKFILWIYFLMNSLLSNGQDSSISEELGFKISNCNANPFDCLPSLKNS